MQGNIDIVTLLALIVAVFVILRLRSVLGRRTGDDEARVDRQMRAREAREQAAAAGDKVVTLPRRDNEPMQPDAQVSEQSDEDLEESLRSLGVKDKSIESALISIARRDASFDPAHFMSGAKQAYEMIVTAYAEGNRGLLSDLLSEDVFNGFAAAIDERDTRGEQIDQSFVGISKADVVDASLKGDDATVTIKFLSQLITATRDSGGVVINGDPQRVMDVTDIWTFARDVSSQDPNWRLIATQSSQ